MLFSEHTDSDRQDRNLSAQLVQGCFSDGNLETFELSLTSLFACQRLVRDLGTSLSNDEDSIVQLGAKESIGRF